MLLVVLIWSKHFIDQSEYAQYQKAHADTLDIIPRGWGSYSDFWIMRWTGALTVATFGMWLAMYHTLRETRRTVDVTVSSQRGMLGYLTAKPENGRVMFALFNIEAGPLFVLEVAVRVVWVGETGNEAWYQFKGIKKSRLALPVGGIISSDSGPTITHTIAEPNNKIPEATDPDKKNLMVQYHAVYETVFGDQYLWRETKIHNLAKGTIMTVPDVDNTFDRRIKRGRG